jgi:hypothetical protein
MKAESAITSVIKPPRNNVYSRPAAKRVSSAIRQLHPHQSFSPSSCGVTKSRSKSSLSSPRRIAPSQSSESLLALELQRKRQQQIIALEREVRGLLEEEYREDVKSYMHQMEVNQFSLVPNLMIQCSYSLSVAPYNVLRSIYRYAARTTMAYA